MTGKVVIFDEDMDESLRIKAVLSSASIPFVFPPVEIDDMQLVDGGTFQSVNVGDPIDRCRKEVKDSIMNINKMGLFCANLSNIN